MPPRPRKAQPTPPVPPVEPPAPELPPEVGLVPPAPEPEPGPPPAVSVLVPYRETGPERARAWAYLADMWAARHPEWEVIVGDVDGPWRKGAAVADAVAGARADVIVMADADVWCDGVAEAVNAVNAGAPWAIPHHRVLRLTDHASREVYAARAWPTVRTALTYEQRPYPGQPGGGMAVMTRATYEAAPIDPRFAGWGQEDEAWNVCLLRLVGRPWRGTADLWHLWHPAQPRQSRAVGSTAGRKLYKRYATARDRVRMAALVGEVQ